MEDKKPSILVLCTGNSARSQMAEGIIRHELGSSFTVFSAGTKPSLVRPEAIAVMAEIGIDISGHTSKSVDIFVGKDIEHVLTVCDNAKDSCPYFPARTRLLHHEFPDPALAEGTEEERTVVFRRVRDQILEFVRGEYKSLMSG